MKFWSLILVALLQLAAFGAVVGFVAAAIQEWWRNR